MKNKGFSFVELLVAMAILGIISLPIASSFALSARIDAKARATFLANNAADDIILFVSAIDDAPDIEETSETTEGINSKVAHYIKQWITEEVPALVDNDTSEETLPDESGDSQENEPDKYMCTFEYQGYNTELVLTQLDGFYRVDVTVTYTVAGETMRITRKEVLPIAE